MKQFIKTIKPSDLQLDMYSFFKDYKEFFFCFTECDCIVYKFNEKMIKIGIKEYNIKQNEREIL